MPKSTDFIYANADKKSPQSCSVTDSSKVRVKKIVFLLCKCNIYLYLYSIHLWLRKNSPLEALEKELTYEKIENIDPCH